MKGVDVKSSRDRSAEADLVRRIAEGDARALEELYDDYSPLLLSLARRVLRNGSDAEEVLQEVFLQVWNQAHRYRTARSSVSTWLVMLTRSRAIDRLRSRQSRDRTADAYSLEKPPSHTSAQATANVWLTERRQRLQRELAVLPTEQRKVLELAFFGGMSQSEIAKTQDIPLGTVKTRTLLAMKKLRQALAGEMEELL